MEEEIDFLSEDSDFDLPEKEKIIVWIKHILKRNKCEAEYISFVFCSDDYVLKLNQDHLQHDYFTDILTFPYHEPGSKRLIGDIFISVDRVKDNALKFQQPFIDELHRVIIHGVLHLIGFEDEDQKDRAEMTRQENVALSLRMF